MCQRDPFKYGHVQSHYIEQQSRPKIYHYAADDKPHLAFTTRTGASVSDMNCTWACGSTHVTFPDMGVPSHVTWPDTGAAITCNSESVQCWVVVFLCVVRTGDSTAPLWLAGLGLVRAGAEIARFRGQIVLLSARP